MIANINDLSVGKFNDRHVKFPLLIYMHGCSGFWHGTDARGFFYSSLGYVVIAPNSFARLDKPVSCLPAERRGGLHRGVLAMRHSELEYAVFRAKGFNWLNQDIIITSGFSEGGIAVATIPQRRIRGVGLRIIEGWGCHAGWPEYKGLNSPGWQPILALVSNKDPWFRKSGLQGDCGKYFTNKFSESIVYKNLRLEQSHSLLNSKLPRKHVINFLVKHNVMVPHTRDQN